MHSVMTFCMIRYIGNLTLMLMMTICCLIYSIHLYSVILLMKYDWHCCILCSDDELSLMRWNIHFYSLCVMLFVALQWPDIAVFSDTFCICCYIPCLLLIPCWYVDGRLFCLWQAIHVDVLFEVLFLFTVTCLFVVSLSRLEVTTCTVQYSYVEEPMEVVFGHFIVMMPWYLLYKWWYILVSMGILYDTDYMLMLMEI
jgi:hypothetical protein